MTTPRDALPTPVAHLGHLAEKHVERHGDYPFLLFDGEWHTSAGMLAHSRRLAAGLLERGLQPGDRVIVSMPNRPEVPLLYNAIWQAGGVVTPTMFLLSPPELRHVLENSGARLVVTTADLLEKVRAAADGLPDAPEIVCVDDVEGVTPLSALETDAEFQTVERERDDLAALLYTGGTTGRSKGVMLSHTNLIHAVEGGSVYDIELDLANELLVLPLSHAFGLLSTISALMSPLRKVWVMPRRFVAKDAVRLLAEHRIDVLQAVPSMLQMLLAEPLEDHDLSSWRVTISGGASLAPDTIAELGRRLPSMQIIEGYGLTETATLLTANPIGATKIGSVGTALPGVEVRIVGDDGSELPSGEVGEIVTRSKSVMMGYWNDPEATAAAIKDDWFATGDIGYADPDGYLFILDRKKDLIIRGGFNVFPRDIEDSLLEHPAVHMAAVIGRPDPVLGEEIVAFIGLKDGERLTVDEMTEWAKNRIGGYKWPREIHIVDAIPLTDVGKVNRKALREQVNP